jgi:hypothetical protein
MLKTFAWPGVISAKIELTAVVTSEIFVTIYDALVETRNYRLVVSCGFIIQAPLVGPRRLVHPRI